MQLLPLLGKQLKDDEVIDLLEHLEMEVVYDFDRLHEGRPDKYWATSKQAGLQLGFGADQTLNSVFIYIVPDNGFAAFSQRDFDIPLFTTIAQVQSFGEAQGLELSKGRADFLDITRDWVRLGFPTHSIHYEYRRGSLALVTVSLTEHQ